MTASEIQPAPPSRDQVILGLDPGTATTGYGVIAVRGSDITTLAYGCILTAKELPLAERLHQIATRLNQLLDEFQPTSVAVEELYFFNNVKTAISVAQARGAMLATVAARGIAVIGYTPLQVKQAITGYGAADKPQMQKMIKMILGLPEIPKPDDVADALAIAVTHSNSSKFNLQTKL